MSPFARLFLRYVAVIIGAQLLTLHGWYLANGDGRDTWNYWWTLGLGVLFVLLSWGDRER